MVELLLSTLSLLSSTNQSNCTGRRRIEGKGKGKDGGKVEGEREREGEEWKGQNGEGMTERMSKRGNVPEMRR